LTKQLGSENIYFTYKKCGIIGHLIIDMSNNSEILKSETWEGTHHDSICNGKPSFEAQTPPNLYPQFRELLRQTGLKIDQRRALDICCGNFESGVMMLNDGVFCDGIDASSSAMNKARHLLKGAVLSPFARLYQGDIFDVLEQPDLIDELQTRNIKGIFEKCGIVTHNPNRLLPRYFDTLRAFLKVPVPGSEVGNPYLLRVFGGGGFYNLFDGREEPESYQFTRIKGGDVELVIYHDDKAIREVINEGDKRLDGLPLKYKSMHNEHFDEDRIRKVLAPFCDIERVSEGAHSTEDELHSKRTLIDVLAVIRPH
jgi:hypothetical protein